MNRDFYTLAGVTNVTTSVGSVEQQQEIENAQRLIRGLKEKRLQKILIYIAYGKPLPPQVPSEEEDLYKQIQVILNKTAPQERNRKIRILANIPEVITTKGNKIGPYKQSEVVEIGNSDDVSFIIDNKLGEIISQ